MAKKKADYQAEATALGLEFTQSTTVAELQALIKSAGGAPTPKAEVDTDSPSADPSTSRYGNPYAEVVQT